MFLCLGVVLFSHWLLLHRANIILLPNDKISKMYCGCVSHHPLIHVFSCFPYIFIITSTILFVLDFETGIPVPSYLALTTIGSDLLFLYQNETLCSLATLTSVSAFQRDFLTLDSRSRLGPGCSLHPQGLPTPPCVGPGLSHHRLAQLPLWSPRATLCIYPN